MNNQNEFINYLQSRSLAQSSINGYVKNIEQFLTWYITEQGEGYERSSDPINCAKKDILNYLSFLKENTNQQNVTRRFSCTALNHYFTALIQAGISNNNPVAFIKIRGTNRKQLYRIYTPDELTQLADNFYSVFILGFDDSYMLHPSKKYKSLLSRHRNYTMLTFLLYQGLPTHELPLISINDIDLAKARLTLNNGSTKRTLPIQATQIGTLMHYLNNIRPQFLDYCGQTDKLFFSLCPYQYDKSFSKPLRKLTKQVKSIDSNFVNFLQTRTSVITHWIQTEGLRKAQYLAGHKNINSTEEYLPNDLNNLINDIQKFNPF
jgi:site-specific recombinase XerD